MSLPPQSTTPVSFMPALSAAISTATSLTCKIVDWATIRGPFTETQNYNGISISLGKLRHRAELQGAGRQGYLVRRNLIVRTTTISNRDPAGQSELALAAHWALEDTIESALVLTTIAPLIFPLQGIDLDGEEWDGLSNIDEGRYTSFMGFEIQYPLPLNVTCQ